jgi:hypothetical protein
MADGTGKVDYGSDLIRKKWMRDGMLQKSPMSFWGAYKGTTSSSIIRQANMESADTGHTVVFENDGHLAGKPVKGNTTAKGTGEQKRKFSDKVVIDDYRYVVDNGTKFNGKEIGDLRINEHGDSRGKLADLWLKSSDQSYFDLGQQGADFLIDLDAAFTFDNFLDIENVIKQGRGFSTAPAGISQRAPLAPFKTADGEDIWLFVVDVAMKNMVMRTSGAQTLLQAADVRGSQNRLFKGVLGKIGPFVIVNGPTFFGSTEGSILDTDGYYNFDNTGVEFSGLRQYDSVNEVWSGEEGFDPESTLRSRGLILGANAFQVGMGMMPNYEVEFTDFKKFSESCLEVWTAAKPTKLLAENSDYNKAKVAGYNYGIVGVDLTIQTAS